MAEQGKFLQGNLFRHISVMAATSTVGLMAIFLVDLVDMIFISMLGNAALAAAVGYAGAILFFTTSIGIGVGIASGALVARAIGEGDEQATRHKTASSLAISFAIAVVVAAISWVFVPTLVGLVGATGETAVLATGYLRIIIPSLPVLVLGMVGSAVLRSYGDAKRAMYATLTGGAVNAIFDPILIFGFGMELQGAALASVLARVSIVVVALRPIFKYYGGIEMPHWSDIAQDARAFFAIALPAVLTQLATPIGSAYVTRTMAQYGADAVAGMAIVGRLTPVAFGSIFALSGAIGPIMGQNFGAGKFDRAKISYRDGLLFTALVVVGMTVLLVLVRGMVADVFGATGITRDLVFLFCGPLALAFFFNGVIFVSNAAFNNLGHPFYSTWINWGRNTLGTIPFVYLFSGWMGPQGVLIGQAAGGVFFAVVAFGLAIRVLRTDAENKAASHAFQHHSRLYQLFHFKR